ncbi:MAG: PH domain-containing protein [Solobacterium sp.]|nr:PH domain-containing protein [Solobacterium sp.]
MAERTLTWTLNKKTKSPLEIKEILPAGEKPISAYLMQNGYVCLTDKRIIIIDKTGAAGMKTSLFSLPYRSLDYWTCSAGESLISVYSELILHSQTITVKFNIHKTCDTDEINRILALYTN